MAEKTSLVVALSAVAVAIASVSTAVIVITTSPRRAESLPLENGAAPRIAYATEGVTVLEDPDELSRLVRDMYANVGEVMALEYKNDAYSENGRDFSCYIANSDSNQYDMFIAIYADATYQELLFLSDLLRPGSAFERIKLEKTLEGGSHELYVAFTQVEESDGQQTIHGQNRVTMMFHVAK